MAKRYSRNPKSGAGRGDEDELESKLLHAPGAKLNVMRPEQRIVTVTPIHELWDSRGTVSATRSRDLVAHELRELLRRGPLRFVVIDIGSRPRWIPEADCLTFGTAEVQSHLAAPTMSARLDDFPDGYCYFASEWSPTSGSPIVVLEKAH
jgi:hypothetical protein